MSEIGPADRHPPQEQASGSTGVAVVLAGAGARGAYEAGVLSVLLPALEAQGMRPTIFVGSSAGAINAAAFGSMSHLSADAAGKQATGIWREIGPGDVFRPPAARHRRGYRSMGGAGRATPATCRRPARHHAPDGDDGPGD